MAACALAGTVPASALAQPNLAVDAVDSADPVSTGSQFSYGIGVANGGTEAAGSVTVEASLPNAVGFVSANASQGACDTQGSRRVICQLGPIAAGAAASMEVRVRAERTGQASMTASVSSTPADPYAENNSVTELTTIVQGRTINCAGREATVIGTPGDDVITGTNKADVIAALAGDDKVLGLDGRDRICGGRGNDRIKTGKHDDFAKGGGGTDRLRGSAGDDTLAGNSGDDILGGGAGDDSLRGGSGTDRCRGGPGRDTRRGCES